MNLALTSILDGVSRYLRGEQLRVQFSLPAYVVVVHLQLPNAVSLSEQFVRPEMCPNFDDSQEVFTSSRVLHIIFIHQAFGLSNPASYPCCSASYIRFDRYKNKCILLSLGAPGGIGHSAHLPTRSDGFSSQP